MMAAAAVATAGSFPAAAGVAGGAAVGAAANKAYRSAVQRVGSGIQKKKNIERKLR